MECHLIKQAKDKTLNREKIQSFIEDTECIYESSKFDVSLCKCTDCGQVFIYSFREYTTADWQDYYWAFWIPASQEDIALIRKRTQLLKTMGVLVSQRGNICRGDNGCYYWMEKGIPEDWAYVLFYSDPAY